MALMTQTPADFDLGQVWVSTAGLSQALTNLGNLQLGNEYMFPCYDRSTVRPWSLRSPQFLTARLVKNNGSALTTPAKKLVAIDPADPTSVTGFSAVTTLQAYPVDEWVVGSIAAGAIFWVITGGLTKVFYAASVTANLTAGDYVGPSGVTAGTLDIFDYTAVPTTAGPAKTYSQAMKNARFMVTATITAANVQGTAALVQVMP